MEIKNIIASVKKHGKGSGERLGGCGYHVLGISNMEISVKLCEEREEENRGKNIDHSLKYFE